MSHRFKAEIERYLLEQRFVSIALNKPVSSYVVPSIFGDLIVECASYEHPSENWKDVYAIRIARASRREKWTYHFYFTHKPAQNHLYRLTGFWHKIS